MNEIHQNPSFGFHNTSARPGKIEFIVLHYVGALGSAKANVDYYNQPTTQNASADFFVGHDGEIWQYNPDPEARYCWAIGGKKQSSFGGAFYGVAKNVNSVHIEMCVRLHPGTFTMEANSRNWYFEEKTVNSAIDLTKYLIQRYHVPADHVIRHYDVNGKLCPGVYGWNEASGSEECWEDFKRKITKTKYQKEDPDQVEALEDPSWYRVRASWDDPGSQIGAFLSLDLAKACANEHEDMTVYDNTGKAVYMSEKGTVPFPVRVYITDLNIRSGPGTGYAIAGICPVGTYTIIEKQDGPGSDAGWGRLLSGAGWVSLDYARPFA